ncbi:unnamed protein product, partial [Ectocarpus sp. 12 AP-2014]
VPALPVAAAAGVEGRPVGGVDVGVDSDGGAFRGRKDGSVNDMGFELSIWRSFGSFRRHVGETFLSSREKAKAPRDAWRYMGTLVRSQRGVLLAS